MQVQQILEYDEFERDYENLIAYLKKKKNAIEHDTLNKYLMPFKYSEWKREVVVGKKIYVFL